MKKRLWITLLVMLLDRVTKLLARQMTGSVVLIPGVVGLCHVENKGVAFSMLSGATVPLGILSLAMLAVGWLILRRYTLGPVNGTGAALILGGALGNVIDRLWLGSVTDMIEILLFRFAIFNVADAALCVGCGLIAVSVFFCPKEWEAKA